jgi:hypothetical protein
MTGMGRQERAATTAAMRRANQEVWSIVKRDDRDPERFEMV